MAYDLVVARLLRDRAALLMGRLASSGGPFWALRPGQWQLLRLLATLKQQVHL